MEHVRRLSIPLDDELDQLLRNEAARRGTTVVAVALDWLFRVGCYFEAIAVAQAAIAQANANEQN